jgi:hypothetical protein
VSVTAGALSCVAPVSPSCLCVLGLREVVPFSLAPPLRFLCVAVSPLPVDGFVLVDVCLPSALGAPGQLVTWILGAGPEGF